MSDETEDLASPIVETLTSSFAGDTRPATIEDVARVYSRIILIADAMTNLLEVAGTRDKRKLDAIDQFQIKFQRVIDGVAEDSKALMAKKREGGNG